MTITYDVNFGQTKLGRLENCLRKVLQVELHNLVLLCLCTFLACWFHRLFFVRIWKIQSMAFTLNLKFLMLTGCLLQAKDFTLLENLMYLCQLFIYKLFLKWNCRSWNISTFNPQTTKDLPFSAKPIFFSLFVAPGTLVLRFSARSTAYAACEFFLL